MRTSKVVIIGAGGFAREVRWLIEDINASGVPMEFVGYVVSDLSKLSDRDSKQEVLGDFDWLVSHRHRFDSIAIGIGNPQVRLKVAAEIETLLGEACWCTLVHPTVLLDKKSCVIKRGVILCAGNIATVNVVFEEFCMVNLSCTIGHEAIIGKGSVINPGVNISGGVVLGDAVLVGTGAQILQYIQIGSGAVVGAGAVVTKDVAPNETVVGVPAKPLPNREER